METGKAVLDETKMLDPQNSNNEEAEVDEDSTSNPLKILYNRLIELHNKGNLPLLLLLVVIIYNYTVFSLVSGKEFYLNFPGIMLIIAYLTTYWRYKDEDYNRFRILIGYYAVMTALLWDAIVSLSYFPSSSSVRGFDLQSLPTLLIDLLGLGSGIYWTYQNKDEWKKVSDFGILLMIRNIGNRQANDQLAPESTGNNQAESSETQEEITTEEKSIENHNLKNNDS